jgi:hypothetical protein
MTSTQEKDVNGETGEIRILSLVKATYQSCFPSFNKCTTVWSLTTVKEEENE